jgi:hypothetical protein
MRRLMAMSPEELLADKPADLRYVFSRLSQYLYKDEQNLTRVLPTDAIRDNNQRLLFELNTRTDLPARYRKIAALPLPVEDARGFHQTVLFEILPEQQP